jgi:hypothetical protein
MACLEWHRLASSHIILYWIVSYNIISYLSTISDNIKDCGGTRMNEGETETNEEREKERMNE